MLLTKKNLKKLIESYLINESSKIRAEDLTLGIIIFYNVKVQYDKDEIDIEDIDTFKDFLSGELDQRFIRYDYLEETTDLARAREMQQTRKSKTGTIPDALKKYDVCVIANAKEYLDEENNQNFYCKLRAYVKYTPKYDDDSDLSTYYFYGSSELEKSYNDAVFIAVEEMLEKIIDEVPPESTAKGKEKILVSLQQKYDEDYICTGFFHKYVDGEPDYDVTTKQFKIKSLKTGKTAMFSPSELPYEFEEIEVFEIIPQPERDKTSFGTYSNLSGLKAAYTTTNKEFVLPMA